MRDDDDNDDGDNSSGGAQEDTRLNAPRMTSVGYWKSGIRSLNQAISFRWQLDN